jgi:hypothetical protein
MPPRKPSRESPGQRTWLRLSWKHPGKQGATLIFDKRAWKLFQAEAKTRDIAAEEMIFVAVAQLLGRIIK